MEIAVLLLFVTYLTKGFQLFALGSYGVTLIDFNCLLIYLLFLRSALWDGSEFKIKLNLPLISLSIFTFLVMTSGITSLFFNPDERLFQFIKTSLHFLFLVSFTFVCIFYNFKNDFWKKIALLWIYISIAINLYAFYQLFARIFDLPGAWIELTNVSIKGREIDQFVNEGSKQLSLQFENFYRATSIFPEPSALAAFNLINISFIMPIIFNKNYKNIINIKVIWFVYIITLIGLFLAFSLTALLGFSILVCVYLLLEKKVKIKAFMTSLIIGLLFVFIADLAVEKFANVSILELMTNRVSGIASGGKNEGMAGESAYTRFDAGLKTLKMWSSYPIFGVGIGLSHSYKEFDLMFHEQTISAVLGELGLVGFIVFNVLFISIFYHLWKIKKHYLAKLPYQIAYMVESCYLIMYIYFMIIYISANQLVNESLWFFFGIFLGVINQSYIYLNQEITIFKFTKEPYLNSIKKYINLTSNKSV